MTKPAGAMREPTYFILASLLEGPLHGYALIKRSEDLSGGRVRLATGTLYTALDRLESEGYVRLVSERIINGRVRRSYGLTDPGAAALRAEAVRMAEAARIFSDSTLARSSRHARPGPITESGRAPAGRRTRTA
jgi:PadR family transcriptional regulator, regulatory protein PadR